MIFLSSFLNQDEQDIEKELIMKAQKGERKALNELIMKHMEKVYNYSFGLTQNKMDAQDLTQEVFVQVLKHIKNFRQECKFYTWLYKITFNKFLNMKRRKNFVSLECLEEDEEGKKIREIKANDEGILEKLENEEIQNKIKLALNKLDKEERAIIILRIIEEVSYKEIAETFNWTIGNTCSKINRAVKKLRDLLKENSGNEI